MPSRLARTLNRLVDTATGLEGVRTADTRAGDLVVIRTKNSVYSLAALGNGQFTVTGGWFSDGGTALVRVNGCTWGGHAIKTDVVAAPGMFVEFDNGVRTTRVKDVQLIPNGAAVTVH